MGFFDDAVNEAVPGGNLAKPLMIAAGALILGHMFGGKHDDAPAQAAPDAQAGGGGFLGGGGIGGALGGLAGSLGGALGGQAAGGALGGQAAGGASGGGLGGMLGGLASSPLGGALAGAAAASAVGGGLDSLLQKFRDAGHGAAADSWVSDGQNHPVTPDQINSVIGEDKIAEIAQQAGIDPAQMSSLLAQALPTLISKLTPGGQLPQG